MFFFFSNYVMHNYIQIIMCTFQQSSGYTPLMVACEYQKIEIVEFLLQVEGVDCKACAVKSDREGGKTGLHITAIHDSVRLAHILITAGCPPESLDEQVCIWSAPCTLSKDASYTYLW